MGLDVSAIKFNNDNSASKQQQTGVTEADMTVKVPISQIAIERRLDYRRAYDAALRGELGQVVRERGRLYVLREEPEPAGAIRTANQGVG